MSKLILYLVLFFVYNYNLVSGEYFYNTDLTIEDIENLEVIKPEGKKCYYSIEKEVEIGNKLVTICNYNLLCPKDGNCVAFDFDRTIDEVFFPISTGVYSTPICDNNNNEGILPPNNYKVRANATYECVRFGSCSEDGLNSGYCGTAECQHNRECFSNNCVNSTCMINKNNPSYSCRPYENNGEYKMKCSLRREEYCQSDSECGEEEKCYHHICAKYDYLKKDHTNTFTILVLVFFFLILLCILGCIIYSKKH